MNGLRILNHHQPLTEKDTTNMTTKKHPQFILALHAEAFANFAEEHKKPGFSIDAFLDRAQPYITIRERNHLDNRVFTNEDGETWKGDRQYRQIVKYTALCWAETEDQPARIAAFKRETTGEERLNGLVGIGFGGHTDLVDVVHENSVIDLKATLERATFRELEEEVKLVVHETGNEVQIADVCSTEGCIQVALLVSDADDVSRLHVGVAQIIILPRWVSVSARESEGQSTVAPMTLSDLSEYPNLENWSRMMAPELGSYLNRKVHTSCGACAVCECGAGI
jgi:predicted NUDIX family phosphoesterase